MRRAAWLLLACLVLGARAEAQDRPPPKAPAAASPQGDPDVLNEARAVRERANCLLRGAQALQRAAVDRDRLESARAAVAACDAPTRPTPARAERTSTTTTIDDIAVEWPTCRAGDPMCNDTSTFDAAPIVRGVRRHRGGFAACGNKATKPGHVRLLLRLAEIDDRARPDSIQVEQDSLREPAVTQCLTRSASRLVFPSHAAAARVRLTVSMPSR